MWNIEYTDEFKEWWDTLSGKEEGAINAGVKLLEEFGPELQFPHSSGIEGSHYSHMRELRIQRFGQAYRILYAFDPRRTAILLIGGNKAGDDRWYKKFIPLADNLYKKHLQIINKEKH